MNVLAAELGLGRNKLYTRMKEITGLTPNEFTLVTWLLSLLGLVHKSFLRKYRRHALVLIVIISAIITPTGDPFTLTVVSVPLYLLYELSILMIKDKKTDADETDEEKEE